MNFYYSSLDIYPADAKVIVTYIQYQSNPTSIIVYSINVCDSYGYCTPPFTKLCNNAWFLWFCIEYFCDRYFIITAALCSNNPKPHNFQRLLPIWSGRCEVDCCVHILHSNNWVLPHNVLPIRPTPAYHRSVIHWVLGRLRLRQRTAAL